MVEINKFITSELSYLWDCAPVSADLSFSLVHIQIRYSVCQGNYIPYMISASRIWCWPGGHTYANVKVFSARQYSTCPEYLVIECQYIAAKTTRSLNWWKIVLGMSFISVTINFNLNRDPHNIKLHAMQLARCMPYNWSICTWLIDSFPFLRWQNPQSIRWSVNRQKNMKQFHANKFRGSIIIMNLSVIRSFSLENNLPAMSCGWGCHPLD